MREMKFSKIILLSALCIMAASCSQDLNDGLVLYSDFERDAKDFGPYHFDGIFRNGAEISDDCPVGESSVYLDGDRAYVEYPTEAVYFNRNYSVSIWVKWEESREFSRIFDFNQIMPGDGNAVSLYAGRPSKGSDNDLWFEQWVVDGYDAIRNIIDINNDPADASLGYAIKTGQWDHYVIVYKESASNPNRNKVNAKGQKVPYKGELTLYVNGKKAGRTTHCMMPQNLPTVANWLGRSRYASDPMFKGWMDDFRIYNRCLSDKEIQALYNLGSR